MMNLKRVVAENFCQYPKLDQPLNNGLTCLLGPNGSGKSNLVRAIYLSLIGEVYGSPNLVRDGYPKGFVTLEAETPQGSFTVSRYLKHNDDTRGTSIKHELTADWLQQPLTKKADVAAFLAPLIGVPIPALQYVAFALQGDFDNLMLCDHAERARMLNTMMGMERAERLRVHLKDALDKIADMPDRTEQILATEQAIRDHQRGLELAREELTRAQSAITDVVREAYKKALVVKTKPSSATRDEDLKKLNKQKELLQATIATSQERVDRLAAMIQEMVEPDHAASSAHIRWDNTKRQLELHEAELDKAINDNAPVAPDASVEKRCSEEVRKQLDELNGTSAQLAEKIRSYGDGICASCGQKLPVDYDIDKVKAEHAKVKADYDALYSSYYAALRIVQDFERDRLAYHNRIKDAERHCERVRAELLHCQDMSHFNREEYNRQVEAYKLNQSHRRNHADELAALNSHKHSLERLRADIVALEAVDTATPEQHAKASQMIAAYEAAESSVQQQTYEVNRQQAILDSHEARLKVLQDDMAKGAANIAAVNILQFARDQLHAEKLPRLAAQGSVNAVNRAMKKYLDMFAFPYGFRLNEHLDFVVDFDSSKDHPANILSGGEKVRAALAMRFALMDVFSAGCGVLIIDEPTTALDKEAINALVEVLGTAASYFKTRNIKILCPTHEMQLAAVADTTIAIGD